MKMRAVGTALAAAGAVVALAVGAASASATGEVVYSNLPASTSGNVVSLGYEATSTSQFGGEIELAGTARKAGAVSVGMSSWACQHGTWTGTSECTTERGARFEWPVTISINAVGPGNTVGALLWSATKTFSMPYRPSQNNVKCTGAAKGAWYDAMLKQCFHGKYFRLQEMIKPAVTLPAQVIVTVAYNTSDYGAEPQRPKPCDSEAQGCPYDSLNVGLTNPANEESPEPVAPSVGADPLPADAFLDSTWGGAYCDGGAGGTGAYRLDSGCWTGYQPLLRIKAS